MPQFSNPASITGQTFDYIILGGGTAGLLLASRLSAPIPNSPPRTILVIEAGADHVHDPKILTPGLAGSQLRYDDRYDWSFYSTPQEMLGGRRIHQGRGKGLGGSSAINGLMAMYPSRGSVDCWGSLWAGKGKDGGWGYDGIRGYLRKFSTLQRPRKEVRELCGLGFLEGLEEKELGTGPVRLSYGTELTGLNGAWIDSWNRLLGTKGGDPREGSMLGGFQPPFTVDGETGKRSYAGSAFYGEVERGRENLTVLTGKMVQRVLFKEGDSEQGKGLQAIGVLLDSGEKVYVQQEVILSAGALQSPQILELSGVGSREVLEAQGIPVLIQNPAVGESLQDHPLVCQSFEVQDGVASLDVLKEPGKLDEAKATFDTHGSGMLAHPNISAAYLPTMPNELPTEELNSESCDNKHEVVAIAAKMTRAATRHMIAKPGACAVQSVMIGALHVTRDTLDAPPPSLLDGSPRHFISINTLLHTPFSRGSVHIASPNVHDKPVYDPAILTHPADIAILKPHLAQVSQFIRTPPFSTSILKPDGVSWPEGDPADSEFADRLIRDHTRTMYHTSGSCAMLPREEGGVVDEALRVYGTRNVRVVDASVFPLETQGNIMCMVYAVAEKAADLIRDSWR